MAKRIKTETVVLIAVLTAVAAGGIVAGLASATNGFDRDIIDEWMTAKEDHVKVDVTNKYDSKTLTVTSALEELNYDNKVFTSVDVCAGVTMDNGALVIGESGQLTATFKLKDGYNRMKVNAGTNYVEVYEDEDGKTHTDIFGNDIVQSILSEDVTFNLAGQDELTIEGAEEGTYPKTSSYVFNYDEAQSQLSITVSEGELRITSFEFWNVALEDTTKDAE